MFGLDNPGKHREPTARFDLFRIEEALRCGELLVYAESDPDEEALKALRKQIQGILSQIISQERAEAARLQTAHEQRSSLEKAGAYVVAGAKGFGEAGVSFLTWIKDVYDVVSIHQRQYRMVVAAWETYKTEDGNWAETFQQKLIAAESREVVEALGFDPLKVDRAMLASAYETVNLVWEDEETRDIIEAFAKDYALAQHSLEWTNMAGGGAFEIVLTIVLAAVTGGLGAAAMFGSKARLLVPLKRLGALFEELAKLRGKVKLRGDKSSGGAPVKASSLEDYVTDEKVPEPGTPPKSKQRPFEEPDEIHSDESTNTKLNDADRTPSPKDSDGKARPYTAAELIKLSSVLQHNLDMLDALGWEIDFTGTPGGGSYASKPDKLIVIDANTSKDPRALVQTLSHETGHAMYLRDEYIPYSTNGLSRVEYVDKNTMIDLKDEGEATLTNMEVRQEILNNGGPDIGVAGSQADAYMDIYNNIYLKTGDRDRARAREEIGKVFADKERPSTDPSKTYRDYYSNRYEQHYDNDGENP